MRLSTVSSSVDEKDYKIMQGYYIIVVDLLEIAVIFTRIGFYGIAKMQRCL